MGEKLSLSNKNIWDRCLELIREKIDGQNFRTWFDSSEGIPTDSDLLAVKVKDEFAVTWLKQHYLSFIKSVISEITTRTDLPLIFAVEQSDGSFTYFHTTNGEEPKRSIPKPEARKKESPESKLSPSYTFDRFVVGQFNKMAYQTARMVADNPGETGFNPLFIYGGVGLGKTHLLHAVGHQIREKHPDLNLMMITGEGYISHFVSALLSSSMNKFEEHYRNIDVLLIDDVQFLADKNSTQEKFFHLFNTLHHQNKQIIMTSELQPSKLSGFAERLTSRFNWGMVADLLPPDLEDRVNILKSKAEYENTIIPEDVLNYIANNVTSNIRALEGSMIRLLAQRSVDGTDITIQTAQKVISHYQSDTSPKSVDIPTIIDKVCNHYSIAEDEILGKRRTKEIAHARQVAMYLARELTDSSLIYIGHALGGRNHSTVSFAHKKISEQIDIDNTLKRDLSTIRQSCY